ncbi:hypothetical protein [Parapusillimonas granuli]|uniref:Riboflavin biosynthesis intermediates N-glycosidase n=1 Tax=Parapusillimonas granuli TaxID=380911 RepID=A0A853FYB6_9BURK|nr:hypothetical protein [Parapusillimonas granuli]MBB5216161.1 putative NAD-dependent protein-ADP-ribosyltransferase YbiA (DUF1768 family) [Parapusillimonas granuli]MEB2400436.1 hypothetical protein [Alcaligenaceae bacterium]NYT47840.1 hypothetical protein [Parapusillimonas granuli]
MPATPSSLNVAYTSTDWRGVALSNFTLSPFVLDDTLLASVEGFIQGIKFPEDDPRRAQAFHSSAWDAKRAGEQAGRSAVYWSGQSIPFGSIEHHRLVARAVRARITQSLGLRTVLMSTKGMTLVHDTGHGPEPAVTSLPAAMFCATLAQLRDELLAEAR